MDDRQLAPHFKLSEFIHSATAIRLGIDNTPDADSLGHLTELATALETVRSVAGPIRIDSGYRCPKLNEYTPGSAKDSAHTTGYAGDLLPLQCSLYELWNAIVQNGMPFDQLIWEYGAWVHLGLRSPGMVQRRQRLMIFESGKYLPFDADDARVIKG